MRARLLYILVLGLLAAAIVHIVILFLLPVYTRQDAWTQLSAVTDKYSVLRLAGRPGEASLPVAANPFIEAGACLFDLSEGMVHVTAEGDLPYWSVSIYDRNGLNTFSFNDRASSDKAVDFVVVTPERMIALRNELPRALSRSIFVESDGGEGILVVRVFTPDDSWRAAADAFFDGMRCTLG